MIIDIFEGVRLHFLHLKKKIGKNRNSHFIVFNFGVFSEENGKIKCYVRFGLKFWHSLQKYD